ncbi:MAG: hypothetical protein KA436_04110 [Oligoflexales bacterium]|nr:hypothetical protein [Oligoflexales bacterium]
MSSYVSYKTVMKRMASALTQLQHSFTHQQLERWSLLILRSMSGHFRIFHRPHHIIALSENLDPIGILSALYHDVVYYQIDGGFLPDIEAILSPYFHSVNGVLYISELAPSSDLIFNMALEVFGFKRGDKLLIHAGQNEFLSALLALRELEQTLSLRELLMLVVCIEATVPFRGKEDVFSTLKRRILTVNDHLKLGLSPNDVEMGLKRAVILANKDVENFSYSDTAKFLDNTWMLLPETHKKLQESSFYTIKEYRLALQGMEAFLSQLDAHRVFYTYNNTPPKHDFDSIISLADRNLHLGRTYLRVKLYETAILEALAELTGGDLPMIYFVGDRVRGKKNSKTIESYLEYSSNKHPEDQDQALIALFSEGRAQESSFDSKKSPLSFYLYKNLGELATLEGVKDAKRFFASELTSKNFLRSQKLEMICDLAQAIAHFAESRAPALRKMADLLA